MEYIYFTTDVHSASGLSEARYIIYGRGKTVNEKERSIK